MTVAPSRPFRRLRAGSVVLAATAVVGCAFLSTAPAHADAGAQPALAATDHAITDVPGMVNGRELGAFTGVAGQTVNASRLIRSESLDKISTAGAQTLASKYHVDLVIDLRTPTQVAAKPDVAIPGATTVDISMFGADGNYSDDTAMYHDLVDKGFVDQATPGPMISAYRQVLQILATHTSGTVLIHCSHGMDRTGTAIDLLDRILGVGSADILHDYLLSNTQLGVTWATPQLLQGTFESDIATKYAGMDAYLSKTIGVTPAEVTALRSRFLVSNDAGAAAISVDGVPVPLAAAATTAGATITVPAAAITTDSVRVTTTSAAATPVVSVQGDTATVTITAQDGTTVDHYRVTVQRPTVSIAQRTTLSPGSSVTITSHDLVPGATYAVVVHSTPTVIGHVTADRTGTATTTVTLPSTLAVGTHTLFLADANGNAVSRPDTITLTAATTVTTTTAATGTTVGTASGPSVATGGTVVTPPQTIPLLVLGGLGALVLAALGALRLRRRTNTGR